jgi:hypothetical protein
MKMERLFWFDNSFLLIFILLVGVFLIEDLCCDWGTMKVERRHATKHSLPPNTPFFSKTLQIHPPQSVKAKQESKKTPCRVKLNFSSGFK